MPIQRSAKKQTSQEAERYQRHRWREEAQVAKTQMDRIAPRETESKDRHKDGNETGESVDGEDRGGQTGISEGRSPAQTPSRRLTDITFPLNRWGPYFSLYCGGATPL